MSAVFSSIFIYSNINVFLLGTFTAFAFSNKSVTIIITMVTAGNFLNLIMIFVLLYLMISTEAVFLQIVFINTGISELLG